MKSCNFPEQVEKVTTWFKDWSECEQTVALYWLLKKSSPVRAKFLDQVLQQNLADCTEVKQLEAKANDEDFVLSLYNEKGDVAIRHLLQLLPLLQVGNNSVKKAYLPLIDSLLSHTMQSGANIEESKQLLSYSLIHPALVEEKGSFEKWLKCLNERFTYNFSQNSSASNASSNLNHGHSSHNSSVSTSSHHTFPYMSPLAVSQEYLNVIANSTSVAPPATVPSHGHSLPSPIMGSGASLWQNHQHDMQGHYTGCDASAAICPSVSNGDISGCYTPPKNGHLALRATNSHAGAFGASHGHTLLHATSSAPPNFTSLHPSGSHSHGHVSSQKKHAPLRRTQAFPPPVSSEKTMSDWFKSSSGHSSSQIQPVFTPRAQFAEHAPLSPQSSVSSSGSGGSDSHQEDGPHPARDSFLAEGSGMREVPVWLKNLRLHKYAYLFKQLTYEQMLHVTEEWLEDQNVTKGARHKIYLSIVKLRERQEELRKLEMGIVDEGAPIKPVIMEMKCMLNTPIKAFNPAQSLLLSSTNHPASQTSSPHADEVVEGDLPAQFCRLMGKVLSQLLVASRPEDECFQNYLQLIDKCLQHEAFSVRQKKLILSWKQTAQKNWQPPQKFGDRSRRGFAGSTFSIGDPPSRIVQRGGHLAVPMPGFASQPPWGFGGRRSIVGGGSGIHTAVKRVGSLNTQFLNKPGLLESTNKQPVSRTQSAPLHNKVSLSLQGCESANDTEINARLDSLVHSVTELALGSSDNSDSTSAS